MDALISIGLLAGSLTTAGFVPQIIKGYRTKKMGDVSLIMPVVLAAGMLLWLFYGIGLNDLPIVLWNAVALALNLTIVGLKLRFRGIAAGDPQ